MIKELIKRRRSQLMVHSYLYYVLDTQLITDTQWDNWAQELVALQKEHPDLIGFYDKEFNGWDGSTGYHLPKDNWVIDKAQSLLSMEKKHAQAVLCSYADSRSTVEP